MGVRREGVTLMDREARAAALLARARREVDLVDVGDVLVVADDARGVRVLPRPKAWKLLRQIGASKIRSVIEDEPQPDAVPCVLVVDEQVALCWLPVRALTSPGGSA